MGERIQRWELCLQGRVQGVGLRPWVARAAGELGLTGWVMNHSRGVIAQLQGAPNALAKFVRRLQAEPPPLAHISHQQRQHLPLVIDEQGFGIHASQALAVTTTALPADSAPCADCLREMFTPGNRRYRHAFISCTQCGPRFSIATSLPYDRRRTSMAGFSLCPACAGEYASPRDRRYHAQPIACPDCGPRLFLHGADGRRLIPAEAGSDACISEAARRIRAGEILMMKNVGGYHLVGDARQPRVLARLREIKARPGKPLALLAANLASARRWLRIDASGAELLQSSARPILLLPCRGGVAEGHPLIAPHLTEWGLMLPSNPLQWLLLHELAGRPGAPDWLAQEQAELLVMTSANPPGEPLITDDGEALKQLPQLADALLGHDREIIARLDDSLARALPPDEQGRPITAFIRRARGYVPEPIELPGVPQDAPSVLALGGHFKVTLCLTRGNQAFVSSHLGDQDSASQRQALRQTLGHMLAFLGVRPASLAHDLHPDFFTTREAQRLAGEWAIPTLAAQHHQAHAAAALAEHGWRAPALALVLDGTGLGADGLPWGGELLYLHGADYRRIGHLPTLALPGSDQAARQPWRMAAALLHALGQGQDIARRFAGEDAARDLSRVLDGGINSPPTSSAGRLFDAAACLIGGIRHSSYQGEAAMFLEDLAARHPCPAGPWPDAFTIAADGRLSLDGLWHHLADGHHLDEAGQREAAARFHASLGQALAQWTAWHARAAHTDVVALAGGCWINRYLRQSVAAGLEARGIHLLEAQKLPCGDGGLSFGQAALALTQTLRSRNPSPCAWPFLPK